MTVDLVIKNALIPIGTDLVAAGIAIDEGKIVSIAKESFLPRSSKNIDVNGNIVIPGCIDSHVHFRDPGALEIEDFQTGTTAAACGGVTTVLDMPTNVPYVSTISALDYKKGQIMSKALVDYGLYGGPDVSKLDEVRPLADAGVIGYKIFMGTPGAYPQVPDDDNLLEAFRSVSATGLPTSVHAENWQIIKYYTEKLKKGGRKDALAHCEARPEIAEIDAVSRALLLAEETGLRLHMAHMSTARAVCLIKEAKAAGLKVTAETCPHYLLLDNSVMNKMGPYARVNPPLRSKRDVSALWEAIMNGTIDILASDHAPQLRENKEPGWQDIWACKGGLVGVETMLPLMLTQVNADRLSLGRVIQIMSENPAKIFGLYPRKGVIQVGADADFVVVNMKQELQLQEERLHSKQKKTPFSGWGVKGVPILTMVRGQVVMKDGEVIGKPGSGMLLSSGPRARAN